MYFASKNGTFDAIATLFYLTFLAMFFYSCRFLYRFYRGVRREHNYNADAGDTGDAGADRRDPPPEYDAPADPDYPPEYPTTSLPLPPMPEIPEDNVPSYEEAVRDGDDDDDGADSDDSSEKPPSYDEAG